MMNVPVDIISLHQDIYLIYNTLRKTIFNEQAHPCARVFSLFAMQLLSNSRSENCIEHFQSVEGVNAKTAEFWIRVKNYKLQHCFEQC